MSRRSWDYQTVRAIFEERNCFLLTPEGEYKTCETVLRYKCRCGIVTTTVITRFIKNFGCSNCRRLKTEDVRTYFAIHGCELLEDKYINCESKMKYKCACGNISHITWSNFKKGKRCNRCGQQKRNKTKTLSHEYIEMKFDEEGCKLVDEYERSSKPMRYICNCGNESTITWDNFKQGYRCYDCGLVKSNSSKWQERHFPLEEEDKRRNRNYFAWRRLILARDNYACTICGSKKRLNAHHKDSYRWFKEKRYNLDNGVTLCNKCHAVGENSFHKLYGNKQNTAQQFEEWLTIVKGAGNL